MVEQERQIGSGEGIQGFRAGTPVLTARGSVNIENVEVGDEAWTHANRFRPVVKTHSARSPLFEVNGHILCAPEQCFYTRTIVPVASHDSPWSWGNPLWAPASKLEGYPLAMPDLSGIDAERLPVDPFLAGCYASEKGLASADQKDADLMGTLRDTFGPTGNPRIPLGMFSASPEERTAFLTGIGEGAGQNGLSKGTHIIRVPSARFASELRLLCASLNRGCMVFSTVMIGEWVVILFGNRPSPERGDNLSDPHVWETSGEAKPYDQEGEVFSLSVEEDNSFIAWGYVARGSY